MPVEEVDVVELTRNFHSLYRVYHLKKNEKKQNQKRDRSQRVKGKQKSKILVVRLSLCILSSSAFIRFKKKVNIT